MKKTYGSFINEIMDTNKKEIVPTIGMGATVLLWSDRQAHTIIDVSPSGKTITIQRDNVIRIDGLGMTDAQQYRYERDTKGSISKVRKDKNGKWKELGTRATVLIGERDEHYDYTF